MKTKLNMVKLNMVKLFWGISAFLLVAIPTNAFAHDALGDDELAVANWMLVAAMVTVVIGALMGIWAFRSGQFSNIEESKFAMLDTAEDYDAVMAESDEREAELRAAEERAGLRTPGTKAANPAANPVEAGAYAAASSDRTAKASQL